MKAILSKIGTVLLAIVVIPLILAGLIAALPMILWWLLLDITRKLFIRLRKDPRHTPPKRYRIPADNEYPEGKDEVRVYFDRYISIIKKDCNIKTNIKVMTDGFDDEDTSGIPTDGWRQITFSAELSTRQGTANVKMEAVGGFGSNDLFTSDQDGDAAPYLEVVYKQSDGLRTVFDVSGYDSLEFFIASLNNGQRLSQAGQIWTRLKNDLWIVNYSVKKSDRSDRIGRDYGYRRTFSDAKARQYFFDKI